jgi:hypothetical protein
MQAQEVSKSGSQAMSPDAMKTELIRRLQHAWKALS